MFLLMSNKKNAVLCSSTLYIYLNELIKVRALRMGPPVISGSKQHSFTKAAELA